MMQEYEIKLRITEVERRIVSIYEMLYDVGDNPPLDFLLEFKALALELVHLNRELRIREEENRKVPF